MEAIDYSELENLVSQTANERRLSERIRQERERGGWSQGELSRRLKELGTDLNQSSISKIEARARSITVNELLAMARAFELPLLEFLLPSEEEADVEAWRALVRAQDALIQMRSSAKIYERLIDHVRARAQANPTFRTRIQERIDQEESNLLQEIESAGFEVVSDEALREYDSLESVVARDALSPTPLSANDLTGFGQRSVYDE